MSKMLLEIKEQPGALRACIEQNKDTIARLVAELKSKPIVGINIAARGTSDHAGIFAKYVAEHYLGIPVGLAAPSVVSVSKKTVQLNGFLVIGVSQSGKAEDVLAYLKSAKATGAVTVAVTNDLASPLAKEADYHIFCAAGPEVSVAATKTFTTEMLCLLSLIAAWSGSEELNRIVAVLPEAMEEAIASLETQLPAIAAAFKDVGDCIYLSRGFTYPIALEGTLKIQETCYVRAKGYATSDFYHGPLALAGPGLHCIAVAPAGTYREEILELCQRIKATGADLTLITTAGCEGAPADRAVYLPVSDEVTSVFAAAAAVQLLAYNLTLAKGLDADNPRNIQKVTITV